jgi:hypothetical protein
VQHCRKSFVVPFFLNGGTQLIHAYLFFRCHRKLKLGLPDGTEARMAKSKRLLRNFERNGGCYKS